MSMINRYKFTKNIYKDYIVLIIKNKKYYSFDKDKKILDYINFNNKLYLLKKYSINFIVLDNLEILSINNYDVNNYYKYLYISSLYEFTVVSLSLCLIVFNSII